MSKFVKTRIAEDLHDDLKKIAAEAFEGNLSMVVRLALREFRDRRPPHAREPRSAGSSDLSS